MAIARLCRAPALIASSSLLALLAAGCGEDAEPSCVAALTSEVKTAGQTAPSPLTAMTNVRLDRAGTGFALIGYDNKDLIRWGTLTETGALSNEATMTVPPRVAGPWYAVAGKTAPGDQLIVVIAVPKAGAGNQLELQAIVQPQGGAALPPKAIVDLPAGVDAQQLRAAMGTAQSGMRAGLVWGFEGQKVPPDFMVLRADAAPQEPMPKSLKDLPADWTCLSMVPSRTQLAASVISRGTPNVGWAIAELTENQGTEFTVRLPLSTTTADCPAVAPTKRGYALAYVNPDGLFFTEYDRMKNTANPVLTAGTVRFGGPSKLPRVAGVAWMGRDFGLALEKPKGPEVWRVDVFSHKQGGALYLPSSGAVGPVSTWPGGADNEALYATYLDGGEAGTSGSADARRYLVKVQCPAGL